MLDFPTQVALGGGLFYLLVIVRMCRYASQHYTRAPGGEWTSWEKAQSAGAHEPEREVAA
jgi:hypothetical protein